MRIITDYLRNFIQDELLFRLVLVVLTIILAFVIARLLSLIVKKIIKPFVTKTETIFDDKLLDITGKGVYKLAFVAGIYLALELFRSGVSSKSRFVSRPLIETYPILDYILLVLDGLLFVIFIFIFLKILFNLINVAFDWYAEKINANANKDLSGSLFPLLKKLSKILTFALGIVVVLAKFDIDISALVVSLGVGSLAIALAAQETISNMISGFIIMTDRPFRIGDRIRYADTQVGDVVEIGIRSTKIKDFDNNIVIIPNNEIVKSRLVNITYPTTLTRITIEVGVAYGTDINKVKALMLQSVENDPDLSEQKPPEVFFINFGDSALQFRLIAFTDHYSQAWPMQCRTREKIYEIFNREGVEIPFPQRVIHHANKKENNND